jgi:nucleoside-diphosphate-sugar epimerase
MKILITGGAGCLGSNLIEAWLPIGHQICVFNNLDSVAKKSVPDRCKFFVADLVMLVLYIVEATKVQNITFLSKEGCCEQLVV